MPYSLSYLNTRPGPLIAVETGGSYYRLADVAPDLDSNPAHGLLTVLQNWKTVDARLAAATANVAAIKALPTPVAADFLPPIAYPSKIVCAGANYYCHLREDFHITDFDKSAHDIIYFLRHSHALVGSGPSVRYPSQSKQLDWEVELVVVFGKGGRRIPVEHALGHVAGYSIGIDLSARDIQFSPRQFKQFNLFGGKSFDDSSPMGPSIVPARFVDPTDLSLKLWVNDEIKQDSHTREMIWSIPELIAELSRHVTIEPGDVLYTGSPAGVGMTSQTFLKVGDHIDAEISGLGRLSVSIVADPDAA